MSFPGLTMMSKLPEFKNLYESIQTLGYTTNLKVVTDFSSKDSFASLTTTKLLDLTSNNTDFYNGYSATVGSSDGDIVFAGTVGGNTKHDYGTSGINTIVTQPSWASELHKNSAVWSFVCWFALDPLYYTGGPGDFAPLIYSSLSFSSGVTARTFPCIELGVYNDGSTYDGPYVNIFRSTGVAAGVCSASSLGFPSLSHWHFLGIALDEASNTCYFQLDGDHETTTCTFSSPSSTSTADKMSSWGPYAGASSSFAMWQGTALSSTQINNIYNATKEKFS